ncbi:MAG TPA: DinB family protein [Vicinamibacteria bacterium]|nr:DinB family protein [Vicinamibacteria bacterium]
MNEREFFRVRREAEFPAFIRVLKALPKDRLDYKPHERSPSAGQLVWTLTSELRGCVDLAATGRWDWKPTPPPAFPEMLAAFERHHSDLDALVARLDDAGWQRRSQFIVRSAVAMEQPLGDMLWLFLFDAIHHRGQLSTYIRPMGGRVPSIYGPSGDDPGT